MGFTTVAGSGIGFIHFSGEVWGQIFWVLEAQQSTVTQEEQCRIRSKGYKLIINNKSGCLTFKGKQWLTALTDKLSQMCFLTA